MLGGLKRCVLVGVTVMCVATGTGAWAKPSAESGAELSQRLQIMAQRQARLFLQQRLSVDAETAQRKLTESMREFDALLEQYARQAGETAAGEAARLPTLWASARGTLNEAAGPVTAIKAAHDAEQLARALQVGQPAAAAAGPAGRLTALAARQAVLAQKLARLYLQLRSGDAEEERRREFAQARNEFVAAVDGMARSPVSQLAIRSNLGLVRQQWEFFEMAVASGSVDTRTLRTVISTCERITQTMGEVAEAYLAMAADEATLAQAGR